MRKQGEHLKVVDEIRVLAQTGLTYTKDPYDLARYRRLFEISSIEDSRYFEKIEPLEILQRFNKEIGYVTCKVGVNAAIFDKHQKILLEKRSDDRRWGLPGGWVDVNETPQEVIRRELPSAKASGHRRTRMSLCKSKSIVCAVTPISIPIIYLPKLGRL